MIVYSFFGAKRFVTNIATVQRHKVVAEFIRVLFGSKKPQTIYQVVLLQVFRCKVLQIMFFKRLSRGKDNLVLVTTKGHIFAFISDPFIEVGYEVSGVHDTTFNGLTAVNSNLDLFLFERD